LRAADAGRAADGPTRAHQFANTARCLLELETGIGRSRELVAEAATIADSLGLELCELHWALGLLARWDGREDQATSSLACALAVARRNQDRWREYKCLTWLAMLALERGEHAEMHARCAELQVVAARVGEDETPLVETVQALAALATAEESAEAALASALARLRAVDDKSYLAYALNSAALVHRRAGRLEQARVHAGKALTVASVMRRRNEIAIAEAMLAPPAGEKDSGQTDQLPPPSLDPDDVSARARAAMLASAVPPEIPTEAPTPEPQCRRRS
jgi:tetratricopeptide (TPR) repeat protein